MMSRDRGAGDDDETPKTTPANLASNPSSSCNNLLMIDPASSDQQQNEDGEDDLHRLPKRQKIGDISISPSADDNTNVKTLEEVNDALSSTSHNENEKSSSSSWKNEDSMMSSSSSNKKRNANDDDKGEGGDGQEERDRHQDGPTMFGITTSRASGTPPPPHSTKKGGVTRSQESSNLLVFPAGPPNEESPVGINHQDYGYGISRTSTSGNLLRPQQEEEEGAAERCAPAAAAAEHRRRSSSVRAMPANALLADDHTTASISTSSALPAQQEDRLPAEDTSSSTTAQAAARLRAGTTTSSFTSSKTSTVLVDTPGGEETIPSEGHAFANPTSRGLIMDPGPNDILMGRGRPFQNYIGNRKMVSIVDKHKDEYNATPRQERRPVGETILDEIFKTGARFLRKVEIPPNEDNTNSSSKLLDAASPAAVSSVTGSNSDDACTIPSGPWEEVSRQVAFDKVTHVIRGKRRIRKKKPINKKNKKQEATTGFLTGKNKIGTPIEAEDVGNSVRQLLMPHGDAVDGRGSYNNSSQEALSGSGTNTKITNASSVVEAPPFDGNSQRGGNSHIIGPGGLEAEGASISSTLTTGVERADPPAAGQVRDVSEIASFGDNTTNHRSSWPLVDVAEARASSSLSPQDGTAAVQDIMRALLISSGLPGEPEASARLLTLLPLLLVTASGPNQVVTSTHQNQPGQNDDHSRQIARETRVASLGGESLINVPTRSSNEARTILSSTPRAAEGTSQHTAHLQYQSNWPQQAQASELLSLLSSRQYHGGNEIMRINSHQYGHSQPQQQGRAFSSTDNNRSSWWEPALSSSISIIGAPSSRSVGNNFDTWLHASQPPSTASSRHQEGRQQSQPVIMSSAPSSTNQQQEDCDPQNQLLAALLLQASANASAGGDNSTTIGNIILQLLQQQTSPGDDTNGVSSAAAGVASHTRTTLGENLLPDAGSPSRPAGTPLHPSWNQQHANQSILLPRPTFPGNQVFQVIHALSPPPPLPQHIRPPSAPLPANPSATSNYYAQPAVTAAPAYSTATTHQQPQEQQLDPAQIQLQQVLLMYLLQQTANNNNNNNHGGS